MASILRVNTLTDASSNNSVPMATVAQGSAKTWGEFDGSAGTIAYGDSFNCASLTDNGTSDYSSTRTNNMGNAVYAVLGTAGKSTTSERNFVVPDGSFPITTSVFRMQITTSDGTLSTDQATYIAFGILGD